MSGKWDKVKAVNRMQEYILSHHQEEITLEDLARAAVYSPWQALRAFSELTGQTPFAYLRDVRLSHAAKKLRDGAKSVLDVALESAFASHEGFTKAFSVKFGITPSRYRKETPPIALFCYYPVFSQYKHFEKEEAEAMNSSVVFTQVIERPARKMMLRRGVKAEEYFTYCEEVGCDVWGWLESVKGALYEPVGLWLPDTLRKPGTSLYCQGVELPADYQGTVADGFDIIDLPASKYMVFQGEPYEEAQFEKAIALVMEAIEKFDPTRFGWAWAPDAGPRFQLSPIGSRGYIEGWPVTEYPA